MTNENVNAAGTWKFGGTLEVTRMGFGAMQLAGPGVFGPPADEDDGRSLCCAGPSNSGINHIDTSDFYGPFVVNELIRQALHPYPDDLVLVTKVGALPRRHRRLAARPGAGPVARRRCTTT